MRYRDLNAPPDRSMKEIVKSLRDRSESLGTGAHGVKHMGLTGDSRWYRPDGSEYSVRDIDGDLADAQIRIDDALAAIQDAKAGLEQAQIERDEISAGLDTLETVTLPGAVAELEAADQAAQAELGELDTRLTSIDAVGTGELASIRDALTAAQDAVESAQQVATEANTAANAASQAALEAAGIAASKGRVIVSETEPTGEDRKSSNIWIQPVPDDPETEIEEKAVTYVYLEATDEWQPTTSSELAQAAQNALDAREAAQQAQQRAETAIANAATAQAAAEAAQQTADDATLDARTAHNEAVSAQEAADDALAKYGPLDQRTIDAQAAADAAQARADEAYAEAASKLDESQVDAKITASANGKNSITISSSAPSGDGVVNGDIWWRIDGSSNVFGQWVWNGSSWVARQIRSEVIANLDVHKLTGTSGEFETFFAENFTANDAVVEQLWTDQLVGKAATFNRVTVSGDNNLLPNFAAAVEAQNWGDLGYWTSFGINQGDPSFWVKGDDQSARYIEYEFPMEKGVRYSFEVQVRATVPGSMFYWQLYDDAAGEYIRLIDPDGLASSAYPFSGVTTSDQSGFVTTYRSSGISDTTTTSAKVRIFPNHSRGADNSAGYMWFTGARIRPMVGSVLIEDGAITTPKLTVTEEMSAAIVSAMSVNTKKLVVTEEAVLSHAKLLGDTWAETLTVTDKIIGNDGVFTGTVDFENVNVTGTQIVNKIAANSISAEQIKGGSFSGETFTGGEFEGAVIIGGAIATTRYASADGGIHIGEGTGIRAWNTDGRQTMRLDGSSNFISGTISTGREGQPAAILTPVVGGGGQVGGGVWFSSNGGLGNDQAAIYSYLDGNIHIRPKDTTPKGTVFIDGNLNVGDKTSFSSSVTADSFNSYGTLSTLKPGRGTSSTANAMIESGTGILRMTASSRRYKQEIEDWSPTAEDVLKLRPRSWRERKGLRPDMPDYQDPNRYVGFIAEEVADAGLDALVVYAEDEHGEYGPDNLNYDRIPAAQQVVLIDHESRIKDLEARIAELEGDA